MATRLGALSLRTRTHSALMHIHLKGRSLSRMMHTGRIKGAPAEGEPSRVMHIGRIRGPVQARGAPPDDRHPAMGSIVMRPECIANQPFDRRLYLCITVR